MANAASICSINGLGGVGKTTLALHYAHSEAAAPFHPLVGAGGGGDQLLADMARLARALGLAEEQTPDRAAAERARDWLRDEPREALILYDNAVDGTHLTAWLPGPNAAIVTTRISGMAGLDEIRWTCKAETARDFSRSAPGTATRRRRWP